MQTNTVPTEKRSNRFSSPLALRLVIWFVFLSLALLLIVYLFMQGAVRETLLGAQLEALKDEARLYGEGVSRSPGQEQVLTANLTNSMPGTTFFLLGADGRYIAHSDPVRIGKSASEDLGSYTTLKLLATAADSFTDDTKGLMLATYRPAISSPVAVSVRHMDRELAPLGVLTSALIYQLIVGLIAVAIALGIIGYLMLYPVRRLAEFADQTGEKNFSTVLDPSRFKGELGLMAAALTRLSANIQALIAELEQKVIDRTRDLERRAVQLKATADVGKAITSVHNLTELLQRTTLLINERFGYYHVGIFLLDERGEYAILSASNSEGGRTMLERGHRLKVGETGIVGYVTESARARIALDVGQDAVFFDNPDLPSTRSEMALPLVVSGQILGALDVQSVEPQAFAAEDIATLQTLADQIAVAIQNVSLYNETYKALEAARQVYGEVSREAWKKIMGYQPRIGFLATPPGVIHMQSESMEPSMVAAFESGKPVHGADGLSITLPIKVRGEVIGTVRLRKSEIAEVWSQDETNLAIALSDQLSGALESARLYRESQQRAARESLVSDISARISSTSLVESIVRETTQELGQALGNAKITFQLQLQPEAEGQLDEPGARALPDRTNGGSKE